MFLNNFKSILSGYMGMGWKNVDGCTLVTGGDKSAFYDDGNIRVSANTLGSMMTTLCASSFYNRTSFNSGAGGGVVFGSGNTQPTAGDYKLSGNLITGLSTSNVTSAISYDDDGTHRTMTVEYTITNTTGADITIGEVGIVAYMVGRGYSYNNDSYYLPMLFERTALATPVTIPAGGVGRVSYAITMTYPT